MIWYITVIEDVERWVYMYDIIILLTLYIILLPNVYIARVCSAYIYSKGYACLHKQVVSI